VARGCVAPVVFPRPEVQIACLESSEAIVKRLVTNCGLGATFKFGVKFRHSVGDKIWAIQDKSAVARSVLSPKVASAYVDDDLIRFVI